MKESNKQKHPGYIPSNEAVKAEDCGCRPGRWCARHAAEAARDAGRASQEREAARRRSN